uniref:Movement protein TGB2 n=1 Tax=Hibiscus chlorotic speck associated virus 3 TaxID=3143944 RepID=A0AAU7L1V5_9VIRU
MPLSPPADHSKAVLTLAIGISLGVVVFFLTSFKGPAVGDNIHSLPFGGYYKDGTKQIIYNGNNNKGFVRIGSDKTLAFCAVIILSSLIYVFERYNHYNSHQHLHISPNCRH